MKTNTATQPTTATAPQRKHIRHDLPWEEKREIAYEIFDRISHGEMLRDICSEEGMPHPNTLRNWAYQDTPLAFFYTCAQKLRLDGLLEELMELTDALAPMCKDTRGNERVDNAAVALMKHRFEAKKWIFNILQRDPNWVDYGQRDPALTQYPAARPLSPPRKPEPPVHKNSESAASNGQPEGAAPEGAGKKSEPASGNATDDSAPATANPERKTQNSEQSKAPPSVHSRVERDSLSASSGQPDRAAPEGAGKISESSVDLVDSETIDTLHPELKTRAQKGGSGRHSTEPVGTNPEPSAPPPRCAQKIPAQQNVNAGRSLRFRSQ